MPPPPPPSLTHKPPYEAPNPFTTSLSQSFHLLQPHLRPPFPLPTHSHSHSHSQPNNNYYSTLNQAILHAILTETHLTKTHFKHLHAITTDGYHLFTSLLTQLVNEVYPTLLENVKTQLLYVASELVDVAAVGVDGLFVSLLRQIRGGGDYGDGNLWLCFEMVGLIERKWEWLVEECPVVLSSGVYVFLRVLVDHCKVGRVAVEGKLEVVREKEIAFCVRVFREEFRLCLGIGRDVVRLLQDLVHVDEFREIWKDLLLRPGSFKTSGFTDVLDLYRIRTSSRYFLLRITPEMEGQLRFLLTEVKLGSQNRYQIWFRRKFLDFPEKESVVIDIVRFICCAHHPCNDVIHSDVIPRWMVIGWLLECCTKNYIKAIVKLALFYDWLFFREEVDNVMNIEPAILLMVNSVPRYIHITHNLLEFLFLVVEHYDIDRKDLILKGVSSAFDVLERKGVVGSFDVLTSCDKLSPFLKEKLVKMLSCKNVGGLNHLQHVFHP